METLAEIFGIAIAILIILAQIFDMGKDGVTLVIMLAGLALAVWLDGAIGELVLYVGIPLALVYFVRI
jgi:hypothetical protein